MDNKTIDNIVWWIPFRKLRNAVREVLIKILTLNEEVLNIKKSLDIEVYKFNAVKAELDCKTRVLENRIIKIIPKSNIDYILIHLAEHCNLNCQSCSHYSQLADKEFLDIVEHEKNLKRLKELTSGRINRISLMGGEPLLNPKCTDFLKITRKYFDKSKIVLVTNGILLDKQDDNFWQICRENNIIMSPTKYPIPIDWDKLISKAQQHGVEFSFYNGNDVIKTSQKYLLDLNGNQNPVLNFIDCSHNECLTLKNDGKLYTCPTVAFVNHFNKYFNKNLIVCEHDYIDIYKAKDINEVINFLAKPIPFCRYCDIKNIKYGIPYALSKKTIDEYIDL